MITRGTFISGILHMSYKLVALWTMWTIGTMWFSYFHRFSIYLVHVSCHFPGSPGWKPAIFVRFTARISGVGTRATDLVVLGRWKMYGKCGKCPPEMGKFPGRIIENKGGRPSAIYGDRYRCWFDHYSIYISIGSTVSIVHIYIYL